MSSNELTLVPWSSTNGINIKGQDAFSPPLLITYAHGLRTSEQAKVVKAFNGELFDMATEYVWKRTINRLKTSILNFGIEFVMEMLGRNVQNAYNPEDTLTEVDIINLATDIGLINRTAQLMLLQQVDLINHFSNSEVEEDMPPMAALNCLHYCIQYVLGYESEPDVQFSNFRDRLYLEAIINDDDDLIVHLKNSQYFYKKTTVRTLLNLANTKESGELDHVLFNFSKLIPILWPSLTGEDKYLIGNTYAELVNSGKKKKTTYFKNVLTKVKGFNYVPESLRSQTFIDTAYELQRVHFGLNNFYYEKDAALKLEELGTIPSPATGTCLTAVLVCKLGNMYGKADNAQSVLDRILSGIPITRWVYYLNDVLPTDSKVLYKIQSSKQGHRNDCFENFNKIIDDYKLDEVALERGKVSRFIKACKQNNRALAIKLSEEMLKGDID